MSKIDKKKLPRGTKLATQHVWDNNLDKVVTNINSANVTGADGIIQPQYEKKNGTFRITWNLPKLTSRWTRINGPNPINIDIATTATTGNTKVVKSSEGTPYIIPFVLPPLQEFMSFAGKVDVDTPQVYLTEFSFGFDQRGEPALVTDEDCGPGITPTPTGANASSLQWQEYIRLNNVVAAPLPTSDCSIYQANGNQGKLCYNIANRGPLKFSIMSKDMGYFGSENNSPSDYLYQLDVPMASFVGENLRLNPSIEDNLNIYMDPYKTYILGIVPPQLHDTDISTNSKQLNLALVNLTVSMKFEHRLVDRDYRAGGTNPTNIPSDHGGEKTQTSYTLTKPAVGTTIEADSVDGLNTTTTTIDQIFQDKLRSGYDESSQTPPKEELCQDSGYDIIAIPLWNNLAGNMATMRDGVMGTMPYHCGGMTAPVAVAGGTSNTGIAMTDGPMTRAIVPIDYPMTIHHAFLAVNCYTANFTVNGSTAGGYTDGDQENMSWDAWDYNRNQYPKPSFHSTYTAPVTSDAEPVTDIGIGVGTGMRGAQYGYRQVLSYQDLKLNNNGYTSFLMDRIIMDYNMSRWFPYGEFEPNWRIYNLPINGNIGAGAGLGSGFFKTTGVEVGGLVEQNTAQQKPFYVGRSFVGRDDNNVPAAHPITSANIEGTSVRYDTDATAAGERIAEDQWLEVRWKTKLKTNAGAAVGWDQVGQFGQNVVAGAGSGHGDDSKVIHGVGGHWLYLVVKKTVVSNANWQDLNLKGGIK